MELGEDIYHLFLITFVLNILLDAEFIDGVAEPVLVDGVESQCECIGGQIVVGGEDGHFVAGISLLIEFIVARIIDPSAAPAMAHRLVVLDRDRGG